LKGTKKVTNVKYNSKPTVADRLRPYYRAIRRKFFDMGDWKKRAYFGPSPKEIKDKVLLRNGRPNAIWVETGTFLGETTEILATTSLHVYSLEPANVLYRSAAKKFSNDANVTIINGPSETEFSKLLPALRGPVNFWLVGHYSAGTTY
jgi:hypothetical protein